MCEYGNLKRVHVIYDGYPPRDNDVLVDVCIADEIEYLNKKGVKTLGCCCGHGEGYPQCLIHESSIGLCKEMGYKVREYSREHTECGIHEILLKTNIEESYLKK